MIADWRLEIADWKLLIKNPNCCSFCKANQSEIHNPQSEIQILKKLGTLIIFRGGNTYLIIYILAQSSY